VAAGAEVMSRLSMSSFATFTIIEAISLDAVCIPVGRTFRL
jgi:hypothetical protein